MGHLQVTRKDKLSTCMNRKNTHGWKLQTNYQVISKFVGHFSVSNFTGNLCFKGLSYADKILKKLMTTCLVLKPFFTNKIEYN